jgi:hypothetical protein
VFKLHESAHLLLVLWDHAFSDHQSGMILFRELWRLYRCFSEGRCPDPPAETMQYPDYGAWQKQEHPRWLNEHGAYWEERLRGISAIDLPTETQAQDEPRSSSATVRFEHELTAELAETARRAGVSLPLVMLSTVAIALARWSGQRDFVVPYTFAGRYHSKHLEAIGYYPTPLLIKANVASGTFIDLIKKVSQEFMSALCHLDIGKPLTGGKSVFESVLVQWFPVYPGTGAQLTPPPAEWDVERTQLTINPFNFDWSSSFRPRFRMLNSFWKADGEIAGGVWYRADSLSRESVDRYLIDLQFIATAVATNPHDPIESVYFNAGSASSARRD